MIHEDVFQKLLENSFTKVKKVAFKIERRAKQLARDMGAVDTGRYRASITVAASDGTRTTGGTQAKEEDAIETPSTPLTVRVGTNVYYAPYIEFGTEKMPPRPILRTAFLEEVSKSASFKGVK